MGYVVLHLNKVSGSNDTAMTAHIERTIDPKNADKTRTHLNRELVEFPKGITNRTAAIQHRLDTAGLSRKIGMNQVRAIRVMLSGSPEDMKWIEASGKLPDWCADNLAWLRKTYGETNVVSAVLHMDEKTPHIHATVVPIVTGERRKAESRTTSKSNPGKKTYRKKSTSAPRLCADDVMSRQRLSDYQNSYAEAMSKYGLSRGIVGSEARHITTLQYYRDLEANKQGLQEDVEHLQSVQQVEQQKAEHLHQQAEQAASELGEVQTVLRQVKGELKTEKLKNTAAEVGTSIVESIGAAIGTPKTRRQQQEIEGLKAENVQFEQQIEKLQTQTNSMQRQYAADLAKQKQAYEVEISALQHGHEAEKTKLQRELDKINYWLPDTPTLIKYADYCRDIGFSVEQTKNLLADKPVQYTGELKYHEHNRSFNATDAVIRLERIPAANTDSGTPSHTHIFRLTINGSSLKNWFKEQYDKWLQRFGVSQKPQQSRGIKM